MGRHLALALVFVVALCGCVGEKTDKDYYNIAIEKEDPSVCDKIQNQSIRDTCYYFLAKAKGNLTICNHNSAYLNHR